MLQTRKKSYDLSTPNISGKFGELKPDKKKARRFLGQRHVATLVGFFSCFLLNAHRAVVGVAIVAMVKHGQNKETSQTHWNKSESSCPMPSVTLKHAESNFQGEFNWSTELQGYIIGAGFLSYLTTLIFAGRLTDAMGEKYLLVFSNGMAGILTFITPFAARWHVFALIVVQFLRGTSQGLSTPPVYKLICNWIPRNERGTLSTLIVCGYPAGLAFTGMLTGWLCDIPGLGWPVAFYALGIFSVLLSVIFFFVYYEHPESNPWITDEEIQHINEGIETKISKKPPPTPWKKMFSSITLYAYFYGLFGHFWAIAYFLSVHPSFMGAVLHYRMTENGITSCLPVLLKGVGGVFASIASYWITKKNLIGLNKLRKTAAAIGAFGFSICMVGILLAGCNATINIVCFSLALLCSGVGLSGVMISGVDMAPAFAGSIMGVATTVAGLSCVLVPVITGLITPNETLSEWRIIFCINLGVASSSGLVYVIFGSADIQPWNYTENGQTVDVTTAANEVIDMKVKI